MREYVPWVVQTLMEAHVAEVEEFSKGLTKQQLTHYQRLEAFLYDAAKWWIWWLTRLGVQVGAAATRGFPDYQALATMTAVETDRKAERAFLLPDNRTASLLEASFFFYCPA